MLLYANSTVFIIDVWPLAGLSKSVSSMHELLTACLNISAPGHHITGDDYRVLVGNILEHSPPLVRHRTQRHPLQTP